MFSYLVFFLSLYDSLRPPIPVDRPRGVPGISTKLLRMRPASAAASSLAGVEMCARLQSCRSQGDTSISRSTTGGCGVTAGVESNRHQKRKRKKKTSFSKVLSKDIARTPLALS